VFSVLLLEVGVETDLLTANEVSEYLRIPKSTLYKLVQEGKIPGFKVGRHWRFRRAVVQAWIKEQENAVNSKSQ
jgi:excisionase family DNA binding protein